MMYRLDPGHPAPAKPWMNHFRSVDVGWHRSVTELAPAPVSDNPNAPHVARTPITAPSIRDATQLDQKRLQSLMTETAHDIRAPLAVARQIMAALKSRIDTTGLLRKEDASLLETAETRLAQASKWAEGILIFESLQHGEPVNVRKRFYPDQWRTELEPLLQSLATQRHVRLQWIGWDRSLPRLYLDFNLFSRLILNLVTNAIQASKPGTDVRVRIAWRTSSAERLIIAIEDTGPGMPIEVMQLVNAPVDDSAANQRLSSIGIGLRTAKSLAHALDSSLSVQWNPAGGTLLRVALPIDNCRTLIRNWLFDLAQRKSTSDQPGNYFAQLRVIRIDGIDPDDADVRMQVAADPDDMLYRVGRNRWLWLRLFATDSPQSAECSSLGNALQEIAKSPSFTRTAVSCQHEVVFTAKNIVLNFSSPELQAIRGLGRTADMLAEKFNLLMGHRVPVVDCVADKRSSLSFKSRQHSTSPQESLRQIRDDLPHSVAKAHRPATFPSLPKQSLQSQAGQGVKRGSSTRVVNRPSTLEAMPAESFSEAMVDLARHWRSVQLRLDHLPSNSTHATPLLGK
jgi:hypothetical protein